MQLEFNDYYVKKLERNLIPDICYLFAAAFKYKPSEAEIVQRHELCHGTQKYIGFIAYHKETNEPAAYYGVFPTYVKYLDRKILVAQSGDTMTAPKHQKKGLFIHLAKITFDYCTTIGIELIFGFPNENSYPGFINKLAFEELPKLENVSLFENKFEWCRFTASFKTLSNLHKHYLRLILLLFSSPGEAFENSNSRLSHPVAYVVHDDTYFQLKKSPNKFLLKIKGINFWIKIAGNTISIGDIDLHSDQLLAPAIKRLKWILRIGGYRFVSFTGSSSSYITGELKKLNMKSTPSHPPIFLKISSDIPLETFAFVNADIDVF